VINQYNNFLSQSSGSKTVGFADKIRSMQAGGCKVIPLHTGDPDFDTPILIKESIQRAISNNFSHYSDSKGIPELREKIAEYVNKTKGIIVNPYEEIIVTNGGIHAFYSIIASLFNIGDELIIPTPAWPTHINLPESSGIKVIQLSTSYENNFLPSVEDFEKLRTSKTKAILINFPNNPTGSIASIEFMDKIVNWAYENNIWIITDEVYDTICDNSKEIYNGRLFDKGKNIILSINSFSKSHAMTGYRLGYLIAPPNVIKQVNKMTQFTVTNVSTTIQKGLADVLMNEELFSEMTKMNLVYQNRKEFILEKMNESKLPLEFIRPFGAFYFFVGLNKLNLPFDNINEKLLEEENTAMVDGKIYGESGSGFLRLTFAASIDNIDEGITRFLKFAERHYN
jgi:aspartate aminotransferase